MSRIHGFLGRRSLLKLMGAAGATAAVTAACSSQPTASQSSTEATVAQATPAAPAAPAVPPEVQNRPFSADMAPDEALKLVMDGNKRFVEQKAAHPRQDFARLVETGADQFPFAAFLSCADSRVPVEVVFDQGIGDCFVVRMAGNVATPEAIGSLEFGCAVLGCRMIMVLGHEGCGAVNAVLRGQKLPAESKIGTLVPFIEPGVKKAAGKEGNDLVNAIKDTVLVQIETLKKSPILAGLIQKNELKIVGGYYDLDNGTVELIEPKA
ncbi:MAG TPA: carbonic anhydrase [Synechococcales cyanobacterium M55_K2018_004]|nr:carbonic anhydrase [Synechococcales cyanobacterium M55_K2018_004]